VFGGARFGGRIGADAVKMEPADDDMLRERESWRYDPPYDFYGGGGKPAPCRDRPPEA
jgi:hypothetical protein